MLKLRDYQIDIANKAFEILKRTGIVYLVNLILMRSKLISRMLLEIIYSM